MQSAPLPAAEFSVKRGQRGDHPDPPHQAAVGGSRAEVADRGRQGDCRTVHEGDERRRGRRLPGAQSEQPGSAQLSIKTNNRIASLLRVVLAGDGKPVGNAVPIFNDLQAELKAETDRLQRVLATYLPRFNELARRLSLEPISERSQP